VVTALVIDDSAFVLRRHSELVIEAGLAVLTAKGGEEGVRIFETHLPDIVLCDIMMPDMDGYEVLQNLRDLAQDVFLYFISAEMTPEIEKKAMSLGAKGIITKPISVETIQKILQQYHSQRC